jgi:hypothetical protein
MRDSHLRDSNKEYWYAKKMSTQENVPRRDRCAPQEFSGLTFTFPTTTTTQVAESSCIDGLA